MVMNLLQFSLSLEDFTRKLVIFLLFALTTTHLKLYLIHTNKKQRVRDAGVSQRKWLAIEFLGKTNLNLNTLNPAFSYLPVDAENNKQERGENVTSSSNHHQNLAHHVAGIPLHEEKVRMKLLYILFGCDSSPRSPNVSLCVCLCVC